MVVIRIKCNTVYGKGVNNLPRDRDLDGPGEELSQTVSLGTAPPLGFLFPSAKGASCFFSNLLPRGWIRVHVLDCNPFFFSSKSFLVMEYLVDFGFIVNK